ncbi:MAG: hypothetical protein ACSHX0_05395 [Akkermansiaceae bacterium]
MKTNSNAPRVLYIGLDVHKVETVIAILESDRDAEPRHYGIITTSQHAHERAFESHDDLTIRVLEYRRRA